MQYDLIFSFLCVYMFIYNDEIIEYFVVAADL